MLFCIPSFDEKTPPEGGVDFAICCQSAHAAGSLDLGLGDFAASIGAGFFSGGFGPTLTFAAIVAFAITFRCLALRGSFAGIGADTLH